MKVAHKSKGTEIKRHRNKSDPTVKTACVVSIFFVLLCEIRVCLGMHAVVEKVVVQNSVFRSASSLVVDHTRGIVQHEVKGKNVAIRERASSGSELAGGTDPGHKSAPDVPPIFIPCITAPLAHDENAIFSVSPWAVDKISFFWEAVSWLHSFGLFSTLWMCHDLGPGFAVLEVWIILPKTTQIVHMYGFQFMLWVKKEGIKTQAL